MRCSPFLRPSRGGKLGRYGLAAPREKAYAVPIPAGARHGEEIRFPKSFPDEEQLLDPKEPKQDVVCFRKDS